jgi:hypothetical protein
MIAETNWIYPSPFELTREECLECDLSFDDRFLPLPRFDVGMPL